VDLNRSPDQAGVAHLEETDFLERPAIAGPLRAAVRKASNGGK
jgi:hypothetical protein